MTLSSTNRIWNSSPGGLRPSTLLLGHGGSPQYWVFTRGWGRNSVVSFKLHRPGTEPRTLAWKAAVLTTTLGPPPYLLNSSALSTTINLTFLTILIWYKTEMEVVLLLQIYQRREWTYCNYYEQTMQNIFLFRKKYLILLMLPMSLLSLLKLLLVERKYELKFTKNYQIYTDLK